MTTAECMASCWRTRFSWFGLTRIIDFTQERIDLGWFIEDRAFYLAARRSAYGVLVCKREVFMVDGATNWSKERIQAEIQKRRDSYSSWDREHFTVREEWIAEGCGPQTPVWDHWIVPMQKLQIEIDYLISLL